jgi:hypothetical protein
MNGPQTLAQRIGRAVDDLNRGLAVMVRVTEDERKTAERLVGDRPIILCDHAEGMQFLRTIWMPELFEPRRRDRGAR